MMTSSRLKVHFIHLAVKVLEEEEQIIVAAILVVVAAALVQLYHRVVDGLDGSQVSIRFAPLVAPKHGLFGRKDHARKAWSETKEKRISLRASSCDTDRQKLVSFKLNGRLLMIKSLCPKSFQRISIWPSAASAIWTTKAPHGRPFKRANSAATTSKWDANDKWMKVRKTSRRPAEWKIKSSTDPNEKQQMRNAVTSRSTDSSYTSWIFPIKLACSVKRSRKSCH